MKKRFNTPFEELTSILNFLVDKNNISQKGIGEAIGVSESQIVRLRQGKVKTKTEMYLGEIKDKYRTFLLPFYDNLPEATNEVILKEIRTLNIKIDALINDMKKN